MKHLTANKQLKNCEEITDPLFSQFSVIGKGKIYKIYNDTKYTITAQLADS